MSSIDQEECTGCGICEDERCPMGAIKEVEEGKYTTIVEKCIGCGVCMSTCPVSAIKLILKRETQRNQLLDSATWAQKKWLLVLNFDHKCLTLGFSDNARTPHN